MKKLLFAALSMAALSSNAQVKLSISPGAPDNSSLLELESNSKGFLLPRLTSIQRTSIVNPAVGLMIYNTTLGCVEAYNGSAWGCLDFTPSPSPAGLGSSFTTPHGSASTAFSTNSSCSTEMISAGYTSSSCSGSITTSQGNTYNMVHINGQCWMNTNLKETPSNYTYNNGWLNNTSYSPDTARYGYYNTSVNSGASGFQASAPASGEGYLYQWNAAMNGSKVERSQGACPSGWHVPSDCEWKYLEHGLGMSVSDQNTNSTYRNNGNVGSQISTLVSSGTNSTGFTALLNGYRDNNGTFAQRNSIGYWWTSTKASGMDATYRSLSSSQTGVFRHSNFRSWAMAIRCLKD